MDRLTVLLRETGERERLLRQKQEEVIHAGKLATIGQLAAGITHELNNPLNNVNLYLGLLRDLSRTNELNPARLAHVVDEAQGQIKRAAEIVSHLRIFARGGEAMRQSCALHDIIYRALSFVQEPLRLAGVTASFTRSSSEILIEANQTQLEQVFVNLLLNAKDAMLQSSTKRVAITMKEEGRVVTILVEDTGPGIPPDILQTLFTPFITTKPLGAGLGLGLSICYSILKTHHGHISAERSSSGGARFVLTFPVSETVPPVESTVDQISQ
jgi:C4-dicarboxylate-specific signal transduction histidine kinase